MSVGQRIKILRKNLKLSGEKFAKQLSLTRSAIAGYETGHRNPSDLVINAICSTYDVSYEWLANGVGEMFVDKLADFNASEETKNILRMIDELPADDQVIIKRLIENIYNKVKREN